MFQAAAVDCNLILAAVSCSTKTNGDCTEIILWRSCRIEGDENWSPRSTEIYSIHVAVEQHGRIHNVRGVMSAPQWPSHALRLLLLCMLLHWMLSEATDPYERCTINLRTGDNRCMDSTIAQPLLVQADVVSSSALVLPRSFLSSADALHLHARVCTPFTSDATPVVIASPAIGELVSIRNGTNLVLRSESSSSSGPSGAALPHTLVQSWLPLHAAPADGRCCRISIRITVSSVCAYHSLDPIGSLHCTGLPAKSQVHEPYIMLNRPNSRSSKSATVELVNINSSCSNAGTVETSEYGACLCSASWTGALCDVPAPTACLVDVDTGTDECFSNETTSMLAELITTPSAPSGSGSGSARALLDIGSKGAQSARVDALVCGPVGQSSALEIGKAGGSVQRSSDPLPLLKLSNSSLSIIQRNSKAGTVNKGWLPPLQPSSCAPVSAQRDPDGSVSIVHGFDPENNLAEFEGVLGSDTQSVLIGLNIPLAESIVNGGSKAEDASHCGVTKAVLSLVPYARSHKEKEALCKEYCSRHGKCIGAFCACEPGWMGPHCDMPESVRCTTKPKRRHASESDCPEHSEVSTAAVSVGPGKESLLGEGAEVYATLAAGSELAMTGKIRASKQKLEGRWLEIKQDESNSRVQMSDQSVGIRLNKRWLKARDHFIPDGASPASLFPVDFVVRNMSALAAVKGDKVVATDPGLFSDPGGNLRIVMARGSRNEKASSALKRAHLELTGNDPTTAADGACPSGCSSRGVCESFGDMNRCKCPTGWAGIACNVQVHITCLVDTFPGKAKGCNLAPFKTLQAPGKERSHDNGISRSKIELQSSPYSTIVTSARICWEVGPEDELLHVTDGRSAAVMKGDGVLHVHGEGHSQQSHTISKLIPAPERRAGGSKCITVTVAIGRRSVAAWNSLQPASSFEEVNQKAVFATLGNTRNMAVNVTINEQLASKGSKERDSHVKRRQQGGVLHLTTGLVGGQRTQGDSPGCTKRHCGGKAVCFLGICHCSDYRRGEHCTSDATPKLPPKGHGSTKKRTLAALGYAALSLALLAVLAVVLLLVLNRLGIVELNLEERLETLRERLFNARSREEQDYISLLSNDRGGSYIPSNRFE